MIYHRCIYVNSYSQSPTFNSRTTGLDNTSAAKPVMHKTPYFDRLIAVAPRGLQELRSCCAGLIGNGHFWTYVARCESKTSRLRRVVSLQMCIIKLVFS
jgi:hypothetical protein